MKEHHTPNCSCYHCNEKRKRIEERDKHLRDLIEEIKKLDGDQLERFLRLVKTYRECQPKPSWPMLDQSSKENP